MKVVKVKPLLISLAFVILTKYAIAEQVCFGDHPIRLDTDVFDERSIAYLHLDCNAFISFHGVVVHKHKILTSGSAVGNVNHTQLIVSLNSSATCPQLPPKGKVFTVKNITFPDLLFPDWLCHDFAIAEFEEDLTKYGATVAQINLSDDATCPPPDAIVTTFKCFEDENGIGGLKPVQTKVTSLTKNGCMKIETGLHQNCSSIGSPVVYQGYVTGIVNHCHAKCEPTSGVSCLHGVKSFIGNEVKNQISLDPHPTLNHAEVHEIIDHCEYTELSDHIIEIREIINNSSICDYTKSTLLKIVDDHTNFSFTKLVLGHSIPSILTWDQCPCPIPKDDSESPQIAVEQESETTEGTTPELSTKTQEETTGDSSTTSALTSSTTEKVSFMDEVEEEPNLAAREPEVEPELSTEKDAVTTENEVFGKVSFNDTDGSVIVPTTPAPDLEQSTEKPTEASTDVILTESTTETKVEPNENKELTDSNETTAKKTETDEDDDVTEREPTSDQSVSEPIESKVTDSNETVENEITTEKTETDEDDVVTESEPTSAQSESEPIEAKVTDSNETLENETTTEKTETDEDSDVTESEPTSDQSVSEPIESKVTDSNETVENETTTEKIETDEDADVTESEPTSAQSESEPIENKELTDSNETTTISEPIDAKVTEESETTTIEVETEKAEEVEETNSEPSTSQTESSPETDEVEPDLAAREPEIEPESSTEKNSVSTESELFGKVSFNETDGSIIVPTTPIPALDQVNDDTPESSVDVVVTEDPSESVNETTNTSSIETNSTTFPVEKESQSPTPEIVTDKIEDETTIDSEKIETKEEPTGKFEETTEPTAIETSDEVDNETTASEKSSESTEGEQNVTTTPEVTPEIAEAEDIVTEKSTTPSESAEATKDVTEQSENETTASEIIEADEDVTEKIEEPTEAKKEETNVTDTAPETVSESETTTDSSLSEDSLPEIATTDAANDETSSPEPEPLDITTETSTTTTTAKPENPDDKKSSLDFDTPNDIPDQRDETEVSTESPIESANATEQKSETKKEPQYVCVLEEEYNALNEKIPIAKVHRIGSKQFMGDVRDDNDEPSEFYEIDESDFDFTKERDGRDQAFEEEDDDSDRIYRNILDQRAQQAEESRHRPNAYRPGKVFYQMSPYHPEDAAAYEMDVNK